MGRLQDSFKAYITGDATATDADVLSGKTAYVSGGKVTGTATGVPVDTFNGIQLLIQNPRGVPGSTYDPWDVADGGILVKNSSLTLTGASSWDLDTYGNCSKNSAYATFTDFTGLSSSPVCRKYEMWGWLPDATPSTGSGIIVQFNYQDSNNRWYVYCNFTGTVYDVNIVERVAGTPNIRASDTIASTVDWPARYHLIVYEQGDAVLATLHFYETDLITDDDAAFCAYTVASRNFKTASYGTFGILDPNTNPWTIQGVQITDFTI